MFTGYIKVSKLASPNTKNWTLLALTRLRKFFDFFLITVIVSSEENKDV